MKGFHQSGDTYLVKTFPGGALVAAIDGLGHGEDAAEASRTALAAMEECYDDSVIAILNHCHQRLLGAPRGVVMTVASFNLEEQTLMWAGVGNVEGVLLRADPQATPQYETVLLRRGVMGGRLPALQASFFSVNPGDTLILATDGVRYGFESGLRAGKSPQQLADTILAQHALGTDDALVLAVRYTGKS